MILMVLGGELYAGSVIRSGEAVALVRTIGKDTKFGKNADLVASMCDRYLATT